MPTENTLRIWDLEESKGLTVLDVARYLKCTGWRQAPDEDADYWRFERGESEPILSIHKRSTALLECRLEQLARVEKRQQQQLLRDMNRRYATAWPMTRLQVLRLADLLETVASAISGAAQFRWVQIDPGQAARPSVGKGPGVDC